MSDLEQKRTELLAQVKTLDREIALSKRPPWDRDYERSLFDQWAEHEGIAPLSAEAIGAAKGWAATRDHWRETWFLSRKDVIEYRGSEFLHTGHEGMLALWEDLEGGGCSSEPLMTLTKWMVQASYHYPDAPWMLKIEGSLIGGGAALRFVTYLSRLNSYKGPPEERPRFPGSLLVDLRYGALLVRGEMCGIKDPLHRCPSQADYENGEREVSSCIFFFQKWREI